MRCTLPVVTHYSK